MIDAIRIVRFDEVAHTDALAADIDAVFFESSNTKSFASDAARAAFRERWLGRYLANDARFARLALANETTVAGYIVGAIDDPALAARFADIGHFKAFAELTRRYPAHLHVNLGPAYRGHGLGARLVEGFCDDARSAGAKGVHVVTGRDSRNVGFYRRAGFAPLAAAGEDAQAVVFLARAL